MRPFAHLVWAMPGPGQPDTSRPPAVSCTSRAMRTLPSAHIARAARRAKGVWQTRRSVPRRWRRLPGAGQHAKFVPIEHQPPGSLEEAVAILSQGVWQTRRSVPRRWRRLPGAGQHAKFVPIEHQPPGSLEEAVAPVFILSHSDT